MVELEATKLGNCWAVRPKGGLGTMGWSPFPWTAMFVKAPDELVAIAKCKKAFAEAERKYQLLQAALFDG
jgi:hypothetical protein